MDILKNGIPRLSFSKTAVNDVNLRKALVLGLIVILLLRALVFFANRRGPPLAGFRSTLEPDFLVRLRFSWGALPMIHDGYSKFRNKFYRLARNDRNVVVIPNKYVDELRNLPDEQLSSIQALIANLVGKYSASDLLLESNLHTRVLQTKITPNLPNFVSAMKEELDYAASIAVPECSVLEHWEKVEIYEILLQFVARISARIFVGPQLCRNEEWLETSIKYAEQATVTVMILRAFPKFMHPIVAPFLPSFWRTKSWVAKGKRILTPIIRERQAAEKNDPSYKKPTDFLQGMIDDADENDNVPEKLAHRELIMGLASVHTTAMAAAHFLYDLCAYPEYVALLREELLAVLKEDDGWQKTTVNKLRKMDSFLKESQRLNPASLLGFHRIVQNEAITLSDGKVLTPGTHVCLASYEISRDPGVIPNQNFDGLRYYELRKNPDEDKKLQYAMTDKNHLHFGHGRFACPGRFFAANELKMVLGELLLHYDFKYPEGHTRPANINADEFLYPDPSTKLLMKRCSE
ncbi:hypothetical protein G7Y89_g9967 [Cudoniella acicularis]|uniref:Cytochrome P450 n=1 Tax=Cudoniella acicularis TaxID=354080 RepID=A0A8H4RF77_9HELO|nr:hypothetical protein G7Y89_g9967 [Cudoniella acicularis]